MCSGSQLRVLSPVAALLSQQLSLLTYPLTGVRLASGATLTIDRPVLPASVTLCSRASLTSLPVPQPASQDAAIRSL